MEQRRFADRYGQLIIGTLIMVTLDQYTKYLVRQNFGLYESIAVIDGFFNLTYITNKGAAFGFLSGIKSAWVGRMFILVSCLAVVLVVGIYREVEQESKWLKVSLIFILGGAFGNLLDRLFIGKVTDFLDFHLYGHHWPAFNVADSCITIGVTLLIASWVLPYLQSKPTTSETP